MILGIFLGYIPSIPVILRSQVYVNPIYLTPDGAKLPAEEMQTIFGNPRFSSPPVLNHTRAPTKFHEMSHGLICYIFRAIPSPVMNETCCSLFSLSSNNFDRNRFFSVFE